MLAEPIQRGSHLANGQSGVECAPCEKTAICLGDLIALAFSFWLMVNFGPIAQMASQSPVLGAWLGRGIPSHLVAYISTVCILIFWFWFDGHYSNRLPFWEEIRQLLRLLFLGALIEAGLLILLSEAKFETRAFLYTWAAVLLLVPFGRIFLKWSLMHLGLWRRPTIIVGVGSNAIWAYEALKEEKLLGYDVKAFANWHRGVRSGEGQIEIAGASVPVINFGGDAPVRQILAQLSQPQILVAMDNPQDQEDAVSKLALVAKDIIVIPAIRGLPLHGSELAPFFSHDLLMLRVRNNLGRRGMVMIKRAFDLIGATLLCVSLSWLLIYLVLAIRRTGGPAIFGHERVGQNGRKFVCYKFRTMVAGADRALKDLLERDSEAKAQWGRHFKLINDPRVTGIGIFLRKTSLDELPQLWNVIKGEMSLVGPRPVVEEELERYGDQVHNYLQVKPGITGLWQVSGRSNTTYSRRVSLDTWYVKNWSLWYDVVILLKTAKVVIKRYGAY